MQPDRSLKSIEREKKRNSPETIGFRENIENFFEAVNAEQNFRYHLRQDLAKMTNMEYYKQNKGEKSHSLSPVEYILELSNLLVKYNSPDFTTKIINKLSVQQSQNIRKIFPRSKAQKDREKLIGSKNGIWEHPIPIKWVKKFLIQKIVANQLNELNEFLSKIAEISQVFLNHEEDRLVNINFRDNMPENWEWNSENSDYYIRYKLSGISDEIYRSKT